MVDFVSHPNRRLLFSFIFREDRTGRPLITLKIGFKRFESTTQNSSEEDPRLPTPLSPEVSGILL